MSQTKGCPVVVVVSKDFEAAGVGASPGGRAYRLGLRGAGLDHRPAPDRFTPARSGAPGRLDDSRPAPSNERLAGVGRWRRHLAAATPSPSDIPAIINSHAGKNALRSGVVALGHGPWGMVAAIPA